ncbi:MAG: ABC transporter permease [Planctomycetota bacterium]
MKKILGIAGLLLFVCLVTALCTDRFLTPVNLENLVRRSALFGVISIGAAFAIVTSGIDLSIGSVICLVGCLLPWLLVEHGWPVWAALPAVLALSAVIGVVHGLLITRLSLQPFVVTLCGLLLYRGIARGITADQTVGFGVEYEELKALGAGRLPREAELGIPMPCVYLAVVAVLSAVFLNRTIYGRYLRALGRNEEAARFSGVDTARMTVLAYVLCAVLAGVGGVLFVLDVNSAQPSDFGNFYELYAIAGAVLGGCALRGGEVSVVGVLLGAAVMQVLRNSIRLIENIPQQIEFAVIGGVILAGVIVDELVKRAAARRRSAA